MRKLIYTYRKEKRIPIMEIIQDTLLCKNIIPFRISDSMEFYKNMSKFSTNDSKLSELIERINLNYIMV